MQIKYTKHFLNKLEDVFAESDYILRYEKGQFKSGYCILKETQVVVINKYYSLEGKINCLLDILKQVELDQSGMGEKNIKFLADLNQTKLRL